MSIRFLYLCLWHLKRPVWHTNNDTLLVKFISFEIPGYSDKFAIVLWCQTVKHNVYRSFSWEEIITLCLVKCPLWTLGLNVDSFYFFNNGKTKCIFLVLDEAHVVPYASLIAGSEGWRRWCCWFAEWPSPQKMARQAVNNVTYRIYRPCILCDLNVSRKEFVSVLLVLYTTSTRCFCLVRPNGIDHKVINIL